MSNRLALLLRKRLGIDMNPHQFRHVAGRLLLDESPGAYGAAAQLLGHRGTKNIVTFYGGADTRRATRHHAGQFEKLRAEAEGCAATGDALYNAFQRETKASLGFHLSLHDTRRISATTRVVHDPVNAAGAKDLPGDRSDRAFAQHHNLANGVRASGTMANVVRRMKEGDA